MSEARAVRGARRRAASIALKVVGLVALVLIVFWVNEVAAENIHVQAAVQRFGYLGLFAVASASGFNLLVPIPVIAFFPFLIEAGLEPVPAVLVIAAGMTVGDMLGYALGRAGRRLVEKPKWLTRLEEVRERHRLAPYVILFCYAAVAPLPNELIVIPMALIGFRWYGVLGAALGGNLIFNALAAAGFHGLFSIF